MDLNINSPSYYTKKFGVIDEIYDMCKDIRNMAKGKNFAFRYIGLLIDIFYS